MAKSIYKYDLSLRQPVTFHWPGANAWVIHVDMQHGALKAWAEVEPLSNEQTVVSFIVVGTGQGVPPASFTHFTTVMDGDFVWHVYVMLHGAQAGAPSPGEGTQPASHDKTN